MLAYKLTENLRLKTLWCYCVWVFFSQDVVIMQIKKHTVVCDLLVLNIAHVYNDRHVLDFF